MTLKVIYTECSVQPWFDVASLLADRHGWEPVYWTAAHYCRDEIGRRFPRAVFHDNYDAVRGIPPDACKENSLPPLDQTLLTSLAACESTTLRMMDRMDPDDSFTYGQRVRLYHYHVAYWLNVLARFEPDLVVFPCAPHLVYDYVLYALCKLRGVRTTVVKETYVSGMLFPLTSFDGPSSVVLSEYQRLVREYKEDAEVPLGPDVAAYLGRVLGDYQQGRPYYLGEFLKQDEKPAEPGQTPVVSPSLSAAKPSVSKRLWPPSKAARGALHRCYQFARSCAKLIRNAVMPVVYGTTMWSKLVWALARRRNRLHPNAFRDAVKCVLHIYDNLPSPEQFILDPAPYHHLVRRHDDPADKDNMLGIEYRLYRLLATRKKDALKRLYESMAVPPDYSQPYIFVALNYQPEMTTSPEGGVFVDQTLAVRMLSSLAPLGWRIYVKEHPVQLHARLSGESSRDEAFYRRIAELPNVSLVPLSSVSFDLIDHAKAVATVNGTAGWEAVVRGKPALVFGHVWYHGCEGVFHVPDVQACREALRSIKAGYVPELRQVKLFLHALELTCTRGCTLPESLANAGLSAEQNVEGMAATLLQTSQLAKAA